MRLNRALLILLLARDATAFAPGRFAGAVLTVIDTSEQRAFRAPSSSWLLAASKDGNDDYDNWYADFDPSVYETYSGMGNNDDSSRSREGGGRSYNNNRRGGDRSERSARHDYIRDTSRDASNVDEAAVNQLLNERLAARMRRDFDAADAIRDQLLNQHSVGVFDKDKTWRTGCSSSGSGMQRRGGEREQRVSRQSGGGRQQRSPKQFFGPNGHDYEQSTDAGPNQSHLDESRIHELLAGRLQAKLSRDFSVADDIQSQLLSAGVFVHDGMKEWRADGVPFGDVSKADGRPGRTTGSRSDRNQPYQRSQYSQDLSAGISGSLIDKILQERLRFKQERDYDKADAIIEGLKTKYSVFVDDRLREWSVGGDFGEVHNAQREMSTSIRQRGYVKSPESLTLSSEDEDYVMEKIDERSTAKQDRDFETADAIRDALAQEFNVVIDDRKKLWSVGGDFGEGSPRRRDGYTRRGGGGLPDDDLAIVTNMLSERAQAKKDRDFDLADELRDELKSTYNVVIDDKNREWHVDSDEYVLVGDHSFAAEQIEQIVALLQERYGCKAVKDYERADEIRDELLEQYNVAVDDRTKEWRCLDDPDNGGIRRFRQEAEESQSSDFKRTQIDRDLDDEMDSLFGATSDHGSAGVVMDAAPASGSNEMSEEENVTVSSGADFSTMTVPELKAKLREAGLPVSGNKAELIERLLARSI